jgi:hypothetical protein
VQQGVVWLSAVLHHQCSCASELHQGPGALLQLACDFYKIMTEAPELPLAPATMARLASLGSGLSHATKVYRIVDFFSAAEMTESGRIRLTRVKDYTDVNEGVDRLVRAYVTSVVDECALPLDRTNSTATVAQQIAYERSSQFVSCWSTNPESHAMWAMYSPDRCGIRVQTTVGKLLQVSQTAFKSSWTELLAVPEGAWIERPVVVAANVLPVRYENLHQLLHRLARRKRLAMRVIKKVGFQDDFTGRGIPRSMQRLEEKWEPLLKAQFLKDSAYAYEAEVRVCVRLGTYPSDVLHHFLMEATSIDKEDQPLDRERRAAALSRSLPFGASPISTDAGPSHLMAGHSDLIESVCVDPRAPTYKAAYIERFFAGRNIPVERSRII